MTTDEEFSGETVTLSKTQIKAEIAHLTMLLVQGNRENRASHSDDNLRGQIGAWNRLLTRGAPTIGAQRSTPKPAPRTTTDASAYAGV